ncbi:MAG: hypothetical protein HZB45_19765 [Mycolicibacterium rufum]|nr:hypothetical protein [Mycolicibacterium rufum]
MTTLETPPSQNVSLRSGPVPVAAAGASKVAVVLALVLAAAGGVAVRDAVVGLGWASGSTWLPAVADTVDGITPGGWLIPAGVVLALLGLLLMVIALSPRRRTAVAVRAETPIYLSVDGIAKLAAARARDVAGVVDARATASKRRVVLRCRVTRDDGGALRSTITDAVTQTLGALEHPPRVVVRTRTEETS